MRFALYSPYLDSFGGGERYLATIAEYLARKGKAVIFWNDAKILAELENRFNLDLKNVEIEKNIFEKNFWQRWKIIKKFDLVFVLSDGSIPFPFAAKNVLHFQEPIITKSKNFKNSLKLRKYIVVCNSNFTKKYIDQSFGVNSQVLYPPVDVDFFAPPAVGQQKKNVILSVGRFLPGGPGKEHEVLIKAFSKAVDSKKEFRNWQLWLAGGVGDKKYLADLKKIAKGYEIIFFEDVDANQLKKLYSAASIYWHAKGFDQDIEKHPEFAEHFGISIVEAQGSGCVPVVFRAGGTVEIIEEGKNGLFWTNPNELIEETTNLINDSDLFNNLQQNAAQSSERFSKDVFISRIKNLLKGAYDN